MSFNSLFVCQFGCDVEVTERSEIAMHLVISHKAQEVAVWGYKKDKLKKLLSREQLATVLQAPNIDSELSVTRNGDDTLSVKAQKSEMVMDKVTQQVHLELEL